MHINTHESVSLWRHGLLITPVHCEVELTHIGPSNVHMLNVFSPTFLHACAHAQASLDDQDLYAYAATLVDVVSTGALVTVSQRSGVSLNINVDYLNAVPCGQECFVEAKVMKV